MIVGHVANSKSCKGGVEIGGRAGHVPCPPSWGEMPPPRAIMVLSWEDVWLKLYDVLKRPPAKEDVKSVFEEAARHMDDVLIEDFWIYLEHLAEEHSGHGGEQQTR